MKKFLAVTAMCCFGLTMATVAGAQQDKSKRPSPPETATCTLGSGKTITVDYSSPRAKGRKIFGDGGIVAYGKEWRAGANEATTFVPTGDVTVGGTKVPAGSYTLFAVPNADKWTLVISKKTGEWGVPYPGTDSDFARVDMKASSMSAPMENFTITLEKSGSGCTMKMAWEKTQASIDIK